MRRILLSFAALPLAALAQENGFPAFSIGKDIVSASISTADARLDLRGKPHPERGEEWLVPELTVEWRGKEAGTVTAKEGSAAFFPATAGIVEMDPANDTPEFVLLSYTGGAHCCSEVSVLTKLVTGPWQSVDVGLFDGDAPLSDIDMDGRYEIVAENADFRYAFGCYACSAAPLQILTVQGGTRRDVTFEPRYLEAHREYLARMEDGVDLKKAGNGFLAGWVAEKMILGEGAQAWTEMLLVYDRNDDWGLVACPDGTQDCDESERIKRPFPEALREFLNERGYPL